MGWQIFSRVNVFRKGGKKLLCVTTILLYLVLSCINMVLNGSLTTVDVKTSGRAVSVVHDGFHSGHWRRQIREAHSDWNKASDDEIHLRNGELEYYDSLEHEYGSFLDRNSVDSETVTVPVVDNTNSMPYTTVVREPAMARETSVKDTAGEINVAFRMDNMGHHQTVTHRSNTTVNRLPNINKNAMRRLPHAIIVGVKKCGTRALLEYLRIHPDIRAPGPETHFFDRNYHRGLEWYRATMPTSLEGQLTIEKTPRYFVTADVPRRIHGVSRAMKLIIVVRDPVTRAISDFTQAASKDPNPHQVTFAQKAFRRNGTGDINTHWSAIKTGFYAQHLRRWLEYFPLEHIHFVSGENLIADPAQEVKHVEDFLGLKRVISDKHFYFNETKGFPCLKKHEGSPDARCFNSSKGRRHRYVDPDNIRRLHVFFKPHNEDFYNITGKDFGW